MYFYCVHGLFIKSEINLPGFIDTTSKSSMKKQVDIIIRKGVEYPRLPDFDDKKVFWRKISPQEAFLYHRCVGVVIIKSGCEIIVYPLKNANKWTIQLFIIGTVMAVTLYQRGLLVMHGSAVRINGMAVGFLGTSGAGKSTIAAALHARGHAVVSDDLIPINLNTDRPFALPGFPMLKIDKPTALSMNTDPASLQQIPVGKKKYGALTPAHFQKEPMPLSHLFILNPAESRLIERLGPQEAFFALIRNAPPTMWNMPGDAGHLFRCAKLVNAVPISLFSREYGREALFDHARMIEKYVETESV